MPYVTRRSRQIRSEDYEWWEPETTQPTNITIHEDNDSTPTGVFDQHGNELWNVPRRVKMGFVK